MSNVPINDAKVNTCNLSSECKPDSDHSVSLLQELGEDGPTISSMSEESDVSDQDEVVYSH